jgi:hypothetical protein
MMAAKSYSRAEVKAAAILAAPYIINMVVRGCGRKQLLGSAFPMIGGKSVSWEEYVAQTVAEALDHTRDEITGGSDNG